MGKRSEGIHPDSLQIWHISHIRGVRAKLFISYIKKVPLNPVYPLVEYPASRGFFLTGLSLCINELSAYQLFRAVILNQNNSAK